MSERIRQITPSWLKANSSAPCTIYDAADAAIVDRIVRLAHGKGEKAGRDQWNAVARARHNRNANGSSEPALDLLEKYLASGKNVTPEQAARWSGHFPLTVLGEAMKRLAPRLGSSTSPALANDYPAVKHRAAFDKIIHSIGQERLRFDSLRRKDVDFGAAYGIPEAVGSTKSAAKPTSASSSTSSATAASSTAAGSSTPPLVPLAYAINDPRAVTKTLKDFNPRGNNRQKVVSLKIEAERLKIAKTPMAFCFVLRSMFEISAKAYATDHTATGGPVLTKSDGSDRHLADVLRDITNHLTNNKKDKQALKVLHGAIAELAGNDSFLSVTSLNQLVHNTSFSVTPTHIATLFGNVFPLLAAMNS